MSFDISNDVEQIRTETERESTWMIGTNFKPLLSRICTSASASIPLGGSGCPCDGCVPACKNTDFGRPP